MGHFPLLFLFPWYVIRFVYTFSFLNLFDISSRLGDVSFGRIVNSSTNVGFVHIPYFYKRLHFYFVEAQEHICSFER